MPIKELVSKLFGKQILSNLGELVEVQLEVLLSFEANTQVSYKDEHAQLKIKKFKGAYWETQFLKDIDHLDLLQLKVFVYSPNLSRPEEVKLSIKLNGELAQEQTFTIPPDAEHAGWFQLNYSQNN